MKGRHDEEGRDLLDGTRKVERLTPRMCLWFEDEAGVWETGCGNSFEIYAGTPTDNKMAYCTYCGLPIKQA